MTPVVAAIPLAAGGAAAATTPVAAAAATATAAVILTTAAIAYHGRRHGRHSGNGTRGNRGKAPCFRVRDLGTTTAVCGRGGNTLVCRLKSLGRRDHGRGGHESLVAASATMFIDAGVAPNDLPRRLNGHCRGHGGNTLDCRLKGLGRRGAATTMVTATAVVATISRAASTTSSTAAKTTDLMALVATSTFSTAASTTVPPQPMRRRP